MEREVGMSTGAKSWDRWWRVSPPLFEFRIAVGDVRRSGDRWWRVSPPLFEFLEGRPWEARADELRAEEDAWSKTFAPKDREALEEAARSLRRSEFNLPAPLALFVVEQLARDYLRRVHEHRDHPRLDHLTGILDKLIKALKGARPAELRHLGLPEDYLNRLQRMRNGEASKSVWTKDASGQLIEKLVPIKGLPHLNPGKGGGAASGRHDRTPTAGERGGCRGKGGGSASGRHDRTGGKARKQLASDSYHLLQALKLPCRVKGDLPEFLEQIHRAATGEPASDWVRHKAAEISAEERRHAPWLNEKPHHG